MTDHKFTDDEIIKALECCSSNNNANCKECPYDDKGCEFEQDALALINRQKAEIERLQKYNTDVAFKHYNDGIKEFAKRLKVKVGSIPQYHFNLLQVEDDINALVKEMTERTK